MVRRSVLIGLVAMALAGCGSELPPETTTYTHPTDNAVLGFDVATAGDTLHVVWIEDHASHPQTLHSSSADGGSTWSGPVPIETGQAPPEKTLGQGSIRVTATGKILVVGWQTQKRAADGVHPLVIARSNDGGQQWTGVKASDAVDASRSDGYFDLSATPGGRFHLAWTDSQQGQQALHYAMSSDGGKHWSDVQSVTPPSKEFCWHAFAHGAEHSYLLYHTTAPEGMILSVQKRGEPWTIDGPVDVLDLDLRSCQSVGGQLAVEQTASRRLHALIWTNQDDHSGVHHLLRDGGSGSGWKPAGRLGNRNARSAHLAAASDSRLLATWDEDGVVYAAWSEQGHFRKPLRLNRNAQQASDPVAVTTLSGGYVFWKAHSPHSGSTWFMRHVQQGS